ncbi:MAG: alpha-L-fucosidase [Oscillospiraceae bacterium]
MITIAEYLKKVDEVIEGGKFKDNWESLSQFKIPSWYREGRFGLFIHWGVYSVPATENEWYPRQMYLKDTKSYKHRLENYGADFDYRKFIEKFNPTKFNADEWLDIFEKSGAKYIMPVAEHHDGIKMYKSELNRWNMFDLPQNRDFISELHKAADSHNIGFLCSNHRAEHFWFMNGARKNFPNSEIAKNEYADLYGPAALHTTGNPYDNEKCPPTKEWCEDWLASASEMIDKNQPLAVYFDWWINKPQFKPYLKKFLAYYYNRGIELGKEVAVFYKVGAVMNGCAIFDVERGQIDGVSPVLWQNDTAIAKNSWGYTLGNDFKTPYEILTNMIDVVSKNGCYMLNVGPKADGTICPEEKNVLLEIGKWLSSNGEAIYGSYPFEVFGEGKFGKNGTFKENLKYSKSDYRFTYKPGAIYIFIMSNKDNNKHSVKSLRNANEGGIRYTITKAEALGFNNKISYNQTEKSFDFEIEGSIDHTLPICIKVSVD